MNQQPLVFKWRPFEPRIIPCAVRWRLCSAYREGENCLPDEVFALPFHDLALGITICARTQFPLASSLEADPPLVGVDEIYIWVRACGLPVSADSRGAAIEFFLSVSKDLDAAKSLFRRALRYGAHRQPRVINTDLAPTYTSAIPEPQPTGIIRWRCPFWVKPAS